MSASVGQATGSVFDTRHLVRDLRGRAVRGGAVTISTQGVLFVLQSVGTIVLARLLNPADFGLVAMATALVGFVGQFKDAGLSQATIQRHEITHAQISAMFWTNAALGAALMILTAACAPGVAWFYGDPRLTRITLAIAVTFLFTGLTVQHQALLKRQMRYGSLAVKDVVSSTVATVVGITMAILGAGYWSIVAMAVTVALLHMLLAWSLVGWRPGLPRRNSGVRPMLRFGGHLTGASLIAYIDRHADNVLIGWYWGAGPLGLYGAAYRLLMLPLRQLNAPLGAVALPVFSRLQNDPERHAHFYLRLMNTIMWVSAPLIGMLFLAAEPMIVVLLGERWRQAAAVFQLLAICALTQPLYNSTGWLFTSRGRTERLFRLSLRICPFVVGSFIIGLPFGIEGVALSYSIVLVAILPWVFRFTFRDTPLTLRRFARALLWPVALCLASVAVTTLCLFAFNPDGDVTRLLLVIVVFCTSYLLGAMVIPSARVEAVSVTALAAELRIGRWNVETVRL